MLKLKRINCGTKAHGANPAAVCLDLALDCPCTHELLGVMNTYFDLACYELATCFKKQQKRKG